MDDLVARHQMVSPTGPELMRPEALLMAPEAAEPTAGAGEAVAHHTGVFVTARYSHRSSHRTDLHLGHSRITRWRGVQECPQARHRIRGSFSVRIAYP